MVSNVNYTFVIASSLLLALFLLAKEYLVLTEELILIFNFFLLLTCFYQFVAEILYGFLADRQALIKHECKRVMSMHRHNSKRLKEAYQAKRSLLDSVTTMSVVVYNRYKQYKVNVYPSLFKSYLTSVTKDYLNAVYLEEVNLLRALYLKKSILIKNRLIKSLVETSSREHMKYFLKSSVSLLKKSTYL